MRISLQEFGVHKAHIIEAMGREDLREISSNLPSESTYIIHDTDGRLWDLKIVISAAAHLAGVTDFPLFATGTFKNEIRSLGFRYVVFADTHRRALGVLGNDPEALYDDHDVFHPDGTRVKNGARGNVTPNADADSAWYGYEKKVASVHPKWERRGSNTAQVKKIKGYKCEGCGLDALLRFGPLYATSVIEAHHLRPYKHVPEQGRMVTIEDFAVLCASCHRIIHRLERPDDLTGLRNLVLPRC